MRSILAVFPIIAVCGCGSTLDSDYALAHGQSVNGLQSLMRFLKADGHKVRFSGHIYRKPAGTTDAIVLVSRNWERIPDATQQYLANWLRHGPQRVVVVIPRDFDQSIAYWNRIVEGGRLDKDAKQRELAVAAVKSAESRLSGHADVASGELGFGLKKSDPPLRRASRVNSDAALDYLGLKQDKFDLYFHRRLQLSRDAEVLVACDKDPLLARIRVGSGELFVVANGCFLLNQGLVNNEHRKLALMISHAIGRNRNVVISTSNDLGEKEMDEAQPGIWRMIAIDPMPWLAGQSVVLLILYLLSRFPAFGRPLEVDNTAPLDFRSHIDAVAGLLAKTNAREFATERWNSYLAAQGKSARRSDHSKAPSSIHQSSNRDNKRNFAE